MISLERATGVPNGIPERRDYIRKAPRPAWALRAIAQAGAEHGPPVPACVRCGAHLSRCFTSYYACGGAQ